METTKKHYANGTHLGSETWISSFRSSIGVEGRLRESRNPVMHSAIFEYGSPFSRERRIYVGAIQHYAEVLQASPDNPNFDHNITVCNTVVKC